MDIRHRPTNQDRVGISIHHRHVRTTPCPPLQAGHAPARGRWPCPQNRPEDAVCRRSAVPSIRRRHLRRRMRRYRPNDDHDDGLHTKRTNPANDAHDAIRVQACHATPCLITTPIAAIGRRRRQSHTPQPSSAAQNAPRLSYRTAVSSPQLSPGMACRRA